MRIIQTVIQFPISQCIEKCCVILEWTANSAPNYFWLRISFRKFGNQDVKRVSDSAALVMNDVIVAAYRCPNKALTRKSRIRDRVSRVPILTRFCYCAIAAGTKCDNAGWQILGGINFMKTRGILQHSTILWRKLRHICTAECLNYDGEEHVKADLFHAQPNENENGARGEAVRQGREARRVFSQEENIIMNG